MDNTVYKTYKSYLRREIKGNKFISKEDKRYFLIMIRNCTYPEFANDIVCKLNTYINGI
jgi:predicted nucleic-acid-binding Zn-ribbon protein